MKRAGGANRAEEARVSSFWKGTFDVSTGPGKAALGGAALFIITPSMAFFVTPWFLLLLIPAALFSTTGVTRKVGTGEAESRRMAKTGFVMAFNGTVLVLAMFLLGFIEDFVSAGESPVRTEIVALTFTTVHVLLGVGLLLVDHYRHRHEE